MGRPSGRDRYGNIIYEDKSYEMMNAPFSENEAKKYSDIYAESGCFYAIKPGGIFNNFNYEVVDNKLYVSSVICGKMGSSENILYEMFNQKEKAFVSWYSGELKLVISMVDIGDTHALYDYEIMVLNIESGLVVDSYKKKDRVQGLRKLVNYIEE